MDIKFLTGDICSEYPEKSIDLEAEIPYAKQFIEANFKSKNPQVIVDVSLGGDTSFHYVAESESGSLRFSSKDLVSLALSSS